jgi:phosphoribosyl 1,2-cyclic phosphodiesterase
VELAGAAGCERLVLFHHEPENDDTMMDQLVADARAHARRVAPGLEVDAAMEGSGFSL